MHINDTAAVTEEVLSGELITRGQRTITKVMRLTEQVIVQYPASTRFVAHRAFGGMVEVTPPMCVWFSTYDEARAEVDFCDLRPNSTQISEVVSCDLGKGVKRHSRTVTEVFYLTSE